MRLFTFAHVFLSDAEFEVRQDRLTRMVRRTLDGWDRRGLRALILDFRQHHGGSFWPLMRGYARFLVGVPLFAWTNHATPRAWATLQHVDDRYFKDKAHSQHRASPLARPDFPVALLIGPRTSSSGEIAAAMFAGKACVRSFGQPTSGDMTINGSFLANGGYKLVLTQQLLTLSDGRAGERLEPDVITSRPMQHARSWLRQV
jgi:C-terminal processing protease CtpA/Prc